MNRLVILGNGFDLAHGLPTSYTDFLKDYLKSAYQSVFSNYVQFDDELMGFSVSHQMLEIENATDLAKLCEFVKVNQLAKFKHGNGLLETLIWGAQMTNWVEIENTYYKLLKKHVPSLEKMDQFNRMEVEKLNMQLELIKKKLIKYLSVKVTPHIKPKNDLLINFTEIFKQAFKQDEIQQRLIKSDLRPEGIYFLNFNYTNTIDYYAGPIGIPGRVINIHGRLGDEKNPIVFGFGDELDDKYQEMERMNENELFRHIKSFAYFRTTSYQKLLQVIDSLPFQVLIVGHSCGLSDRTLLNYVFESPNCKSIKIYHYKDEPNYITTTQEISRHFRDKVSMRAKIVPFNEADRCPQWNDHS